MPSSSEQAPSATAGSPLPLPKQPDITQRQSSSRRRSHTHTLPPTHTYTSHRAACIRVHQHFHQGEAASHETRLFCNTGRGHGFNNQKEICSVPVKLSLTGTLHFGQSEMSFNVLEALHLPSLLLHRLHPSLHAPYLNDRAVK